MIKILAKDYTQAVNVICDCLKGDNIPFDLFVSKSKSSSKQYLEHAVQGDAILLIGNVGEFSALFAETFGLTMFYDKFAEKSVAEYCKLAHLPMPAQHVLDKICYLPETFNHYSAVYGYQCACFGEYNKKHIYILPDEKRECEVLYVNYVCKDLLKSQSQMTKYVYKLFGLSHVEVERRLDTLNRIVSRSCETENLDSKVTLLFPSKCAKSVVNQVVEQFEKTFEGAIYAKREQSLAKTVVQLLAQIGKTLSTAESITGGMIASSIVDIAGSSKVFYEGAVTYSSIAKSKRLGISPHYIDEYGAVSPQVAKAMAEGLLNNGSDIAVATTGYAGPESDGKNPVGLCYIAVASGRGVSVTKHLFNGDRNSIRAQATNTALFLVAKCITN